MCAGTETSITLSDHTGTIVKWQQSTDGTTWNDIASTANPYPTGNLSTATSFRAVVKNGTCTEATSSEATVSITPTVSTPSFTGSPDANRCSGPGTTTYTATADYATSYKWSLSPETAGTISETGTVIWNEAFGSQNGENAYITVTATGECGKKSTILTVRSVTSPTANAGVDQAKCSDPNASTTFTLNGTANFASDDTYGNRLWTIVSRTGITDVTITNPGELKSTVVINGIGSVVLRLTASRTQPITCNAATDEVQLTVNQNPAAPTVPILEGRTEFYTGEPAFNFAGDPAGGTFSLKRLSDGKTFTLANGYFNPCNPNYGADDYTLTYTYTDGNKCSSSVVYPFTLKQSTYTVVISADPFTICRGQHTNYTAKVYRDAEVIYPYLEDPASIVQPDIETTYNPAYDPYLPADVDSIHFDYAARFFQPVVVSGTLVPADEFSYQWTKNDEQDISKDANVFNQAGLSSTDYYRVRVTQKSSNACITTITDQKSNPLFIADPAGYAAAVLANTNPICQGDNTLQFTATLGEFDWVKANAQYRWMLKRGENIYPIGNLFTAPGTAEDLTLTAAEINAALSAIPVEPAEVIDGDLVYLEFSSDIESIYSDKCKTKPQSSADPIIVNDIDAEAPDQSTTICAGSSTTFTVTANATGTGQVNYNWLVTDESGNETTYSTTNPSLEIGASLPAGEYKLSVNVSITIEGATAPCEVNSLPLGTLTVRDIVAQTLSGGGTYCEVDPIAQEIWLNGVQDNINYSLVFTPANGGESQTIETLTSANATAEGVLNFTSQTAAGTYEVKASFGDTPQCTETMTGNASIAIEPADDFEGALEVWYIENNEDDYELRAIVDESSLPEGVTLDQLTYDWYTGKEDPDTGEINWALASGNDPSSIIQLPGGDEYRYRVIVKGPDGLCIEDLLLEILQPATPLPVIMLYFNAEVQQDNVVLRWATGQEQNNTGFEVQLSTNGTIYRTLAFVETENGNSSAIQTYNYTDTEYGKHGIR
ncbi:MAG: hypothetical protein KY428_08220, partial [Bacteroidetes bacterium]|nr:hypothetical protein [Bacteroidota bacterium]